MPQPKRKYQLWSKWGWLNFHWIIFVWKVINKPRLEGKLASTFEREHGLPKKPFLSLRAFLLQKKKKKKWMYWKIVRVKHQSFTELWTLRNDDVTVWPTHRCSCSPSFMFDEFLSLCLPSLAPAVACHPRLYPGQFSRLESLAILLSGCYPKKLVA